jgi:hypothetical protein
MNRASILGIAGIMALVLASVAFSPGRAQRGSLPVIEVYKTPACGCCSLWLDHLRAHGFDGRATDVDDLGPIRARHGVPQALQSCHTAVVEGYVIEGHVPAAEVHRLLKERPAVAGLAVPGMPIGSPGMEVGTQVQPYDVIAFDRQGGRRVFASYGR